MFYLNHAKGSHVFMIVQTRRCRITHEKEHHTHNSNEEFAPIGREKPSDT